MSRKKQQNSSSTAWADARNAAFQLVNPSSFDVLGDLGQAAAGYSDARRAFDEAQRALEQAGEVYNDAWDAAKRAEWKPEQLRQLPHVADNPPPRRKRGTGKRGTAAGSESAAADQNGDSAGPMDGRGASSAATEAPQEPASDPGVGDSATDDWTPAGASTGSSAME